MGNECIVFTCDNNAFCLDAVNIIEITFVSLLTILWDFDDNEELFGLINLKWKLGIFVVVDNNTV